MQNISGNILRSMKDTKKWLSVIVKIPRLEKMHPTTDDNQWLH